MIAPGDAVEAAARYHAGMTAYHLTIITGASRGMGLAMAEQRLDAGHRLLCISRQANTALASRASPSGTAPQQWTQDLSKTEEAAGRLGAWLGGLNRDDVASVTLINIAGVLPKIAPLALALRVDLEAPMLLTGAFLQATRAWACPRKVLNISSGLGRRAMASQAAYCGAKAGMDLFTHCVALEEAARRNGARVCSLAPGVIDTDMQVQLRGADSASFPDIGNFVGMKDKGMLSSPHDAATRVLAYLDRPDFGSKPVADVRDA
jgi:NAD(P)-dependent dehydrogenase (short-subunit alcohol dehydrogenase family)